MYSESKNIIWTCDVVMQSDQNISLIYSGTICTEKSNCASVHYYSWMLLLAESKWNAHAWRVRLNTQKVYSTLDDCFCLINKRLCIFVYRSAICSGPNLHLSLIIFELFHANLKRKAGSLMISPVWLLWSASTSRMDTTCFSHSLSR